jgi:DNA repair protein RecN (Recombination protein N)
MQSYLGSFEFDPEKLHETQERLEYLLGLERRYGQPVDSILEEREKWGQELDMLSLENDEREKLKKDVDSTLVRLKQSASKLRDSRVRAAKKLDGLVTDEMEKLMIPGATFRTGIDREIDPNSPLKLNGQPIKLGHDGIDHVEFYVRTNPGEAEGSVSEIASTGEISRIALALKKVTHAGATSGTLIFDEIDAGVGADLGGIIAQELMDLGGRYQIICITHLPQIAASGDTHIVVSKQSGKERTAVKAAVVDGKERIREISRMLGGRQGSEKRLALAEEMLQKRQGRRNSVRVRP